MIRSLTVLFMKLILVVLLALGLIGAMGCSRPAPRVILHGDTTFTMGERSCIQEALDIWDEQTDGLADVGVIYDRDPKSFSVSYKYSLMRWSGAEAKVYDENHNDGSEVYGLTLGNAHNGVPSTMWLVPSRFEGYKPHETCVLTVMHEIGHFLEIPIHAKDLHSVMYHHVVRDRAPCLKQEDLDMFCKHTECEGHHLKACAE